MPALPGWLTLRTALAGLGALVLIALLWSWHSRGQEVERQELLLEHIADAATMATVEPDEDGKRQRLKPDQVPEAIAALKISLTSAMDALEAISEDTEEAKRISDEADARLAEQIDRMQRESAEQSPDGWNPWGD